MRLQGLVVIAVLSCIALGNAAAATATSATDPEPGVEDRPPEETVVPDDASIASDHPFDLGLGETAVLENGLEVTFVEVIADSRCPTGVQCVWEGNAEIRVDTALSGAEATSLRLNTNPGFQTEATLPGYTVELIDLAPYPRSDTPLGESYRATLVVRMGDSDPVGTLAPASESP